MINDQDIKRLKKLVDLVSRQHPTLNQQRMILVDELFEILESVKNVESTNDE